jgi:hypothetical protein
MAAKQNRPKSPARQVQARRQPRGAGGRFAKGKPVPPAADPGPPAPSPEPPRKPAKIRYPKPGATAGRSASGARAAGKRSRTAKSPAQQAKGGPPAPLAPRASGERNGACNGRSQRHRSANGVFTGLAAGFRRAVVGGCR